MKNVIILLCVIFMLPLSQEQEQEFDYTDLLNNREHGDGLAIGNPCGQPFYLKVVVFGDLTLNDTLQVAFGRVRITGDLYLNGYGKKKLCTSSLILVEGEEID